MKGPKNGKIGLQTPQQEASKASINPKLIVVTETLNPITYSNGNPLSVLKFP